MAFVSVMFVCLCQCILRTKPRVWCPTIVKRIQSIVHDFHFQAAMTVVSRRPIVLLQLLHELYI